MHVMQSAFDSKPPGIKINSRTYAWKIKYITQELIIWETLTSHNIKKYNFPILLDKLTRNGITDENKCTIYMALELSHKGDVANILCYTLHRTQ